MLRKFASIAHPEEFAYAYDSDAWTSNAPVHTDFRMFQTYGDGLCQHSGDWAVTTEHLSDYLFSLAQYMLTDTELADRLNWTLHAEPQLETIQFAGSVIWKPIDEEHQWEKKTRYFSIQERKITSDRNKEYDKRYQRVDKNHNGTPDAIYAMLIPEYAGGLERLLYAKAIRDSNAYHGWMDLPPIFLKWTMDRDTAREIMHALEAAQEVCESSRLRHSAENTIEAHKRNLERAKEQAAEVEKLAEDLTA